MSLSDFVVPTTVVNNYLWDTLKKVEPSFATQYSNVPFFPLGDSASGDAAWANKTYVIYDRIIRSSMRDAFHPIKHDHILYAIKGSDIATLQWSSAIQYILDRQDDAAKDVNSWNASQPTPTKVFFHNFRVYQTNKSEVRDWSSKSYYITEFIVDVKYHFVNDIDSILLNS